MDLARIRKRVARAERASRRDFSRYLGDPCAYARDVLKVDIWSKQEEILSSLIKPPYRTLVKSSHSVGKTFTAAVAVCWWYDTRDPGVAITTAPTARDVRDLLWREIRLLRRRARLGGFHGHAEPLMHSAPDHYAKGFTAERGESFQGRHDTNMLFVFDEAVGVSPIFWETTKTMFSGHGGHAWLAIFNPTDTTSQAYAEDHALGLSGDPSWRRITMGSFEHPNIIAELKGEPAPYPGAVRLRQLEEAIAEGCVRV